MAVKKRALEDIAFWLSMDLQPHDTWFNDSWIPNYPMWRCEPRYKGDLRRVEALYTPDVMEQIKIAHDIHTLKQIWLTY